MDEIKVLLKHHHNKIKFSLLTLFTIIVIAIGISLTFSLNATRYSQQCSTMFDTKDLDSKKRICCNADHYNSTDPICKIKCDTLEVSPDSQFCKEIIESQEESPLSKELNKVEEQSKEAPKCLNFSIKNTTESISYPLLKPSNPLTFEFNAQAQKNRPAYFVYEYYTIENNDLRTARPISFEEGKNLISVSPAKPGTGNLYRDSFQALYENFYKPNLNKDKKIPQDVLVATSIIDDKNQRVLQPQSCFSLFRISEESSYCREFKLSTATLTDDEKLKVSLVSNLPSTYSYEFRFLNLDNYRTINSIKEYEPISFTRVNNENVPYSFTQEAKGNNSINVEFDWNDFYQKDLNNNNKYPENIKIQAFIRPVASTKIESIVPCSLEFEMDLDQGLDLCKDLSISGGTKDSSGNIILKSGQNITLELEANTKNIDKFIYTFHNLDNLISNKEKNGVKNAAPIYFQKENPYKIEKDSKNTNSKSILVSFSDLYFVDLATSQGPKNIQVRGFFEDSNERFSNLNKECVVDFKIE